MLPCVCWKCSWLYRGFYLLVGVHETGLLGMVAPVLLRALEVVGRYTGHCTRCWHTSIQLVCLSFTIRCASKLTSLLWRSRWCKYFWCKCCFIVLDLWFVEVRNVLRTEWISTFFIQTQQVHTEKVGNYVLYNLIQVCNCISIRTYMCS